ncbi:tyrosine-type recombinase/integrase [Paralysiella testudinis]|uniref:Tyrosine-type recombinase/integrase n=2 Tax=Paralysiella testudinis TaxID=2809020 RepID=A0A892ZHY6_9NEIS|nr:tyrosine-type recombinase/integrase [Paralysiella testudinis]QRQ81447.1 tyrosine-type recombinase/integrase [Paralysiella testudinis]
MTSNCEQTLGKLKEIIDRRLMNAKSYLICNHRGGALTVDAMGKRFAKIRAQAIAKFPELKDELSACQFRDLRAKSGTDAYLQSDSVETAQKHLGHANPSMTKRYIRRDKALTPLENCGTPAKIAEKSDE